MNDTSSKFLPIWEVEDHYRCPVIGAVLTVEKHKQILKKCGYNVRNMKPYEYHQCLMSQLGTENSVSIKVNNYLKSRSGKFMTAILGKSEKEILGLWKEQSHSGNIGPLMFAIVSYKEINMALMMDVYGEVHMQAHANMTRIHDIRKKLVYADEKIKREKQTSNRKTEEIRKLVKINKTNLQKIGRMEQERQIMENQIHEMEFSSVTHVKQKEAIRHLKEKVLELEAVLQQRDEHIQVKEREKRALQIEFFSLKSEKETVEKQMQALIDDFFSIDVQGPEGPCSCTAENCASEDCKKENCARYQLCAKRIFMIGGMTKMESYYRDIVEKAGGQFDYHSGYCKNASVNLAARVKRSDLVICPVNCNSHTACIRVKKLCNQYNKQLKMLSSSSLSSVSQAVFNPAHGTVLN